MTPWDHFGASYFKMLNDTNVASADAYVRTCRRIRNSKKKEVYVTILSKATSFNYWGLLPVDVYGFFDAPFKPLMFIIKNPRPVNYELLRGRSLESVFEW